MAAPIEFNLSFLMVTSSQHMDTVSADISTINFRNIQRAFLDLDSFMRLYEIVRCYLSRSRHLLPAFGTQGWLTIQNNLQDAEPGSVPREAYPLHVVQF